MTDATEFWCHPAALATLIDRDRCEPYEEKLVREALDLARRSGPVERIGVVGVGAGRELTTIRSVAPDSEIVGWDLSAPMVAACRRRIEQLGLERCSVHRRSVEMVSTEQWFDVIIGLNAAYSYLQPLASRRAAFDTTHRLLRPGGCLGMVVQQRNGRPDWALWFAARNLASRLGIVTKGPHEHLSRLGDIAVPVHHFNRTELRHEMDRAGFASAVITSLRAREEALPWTSPNPLVVLAVASGEPGG